MIQATSHKSTIKWKPTPSKNIVDGSTQLIPQIVDREDAIGLDKLTYDAIDTSRIAGLKPTAAMSIAEALCEMIGQTLNSGRGVKFGNYFYVRPYLTGTVSMTNPHLTDANELRTRLISGEGLKLSIANFNWRNVNETGDEPVYDDVYGDYAHAPAGFIRKGTGFYINGENLDFAEGDTVTLTYGEGEEATTINLTPTEARGVYQKFAWPAALADVAAGTALKIVFNKKDGDLTYSTEVVAILAAAS